MGHLYNYTATCSYLSFSCVMNFGQKVELQVQHSISISNIRINS